MWTEPSGTVDGVPPPANVALNARCNLCYNQLTQRAGRQSGARRRPDVTTSERSGAAPEPSAS